MGSVSTTQTSSLGLWGRPYPISARILWTRHQCSPSLIGLQPHSIIFWIDLTYWDDMIIYRKHSRAQPLGPKLPKIYNVLVNKKVQTVSSSLAQRLHDHDDFPRRCRYLCNHGLMCKCFDQHFALGRQKIMYGVIFPPTHRGPMNLNVPCNDTWLPLLLSENCQLYFWQYCAAKCEACPGAAWFCEMDGGEGFSIKKSRLCNTCDFWVLTQTSFDRLRIHVLITRSMVASTSFSVCTLTIMHVLIRTNYLCMYLFRRMAATLQGCA